MIFQLLREDPAFWIGFAVAMVSLLFLPLVPFSSATTISQTLCMSGAFISLVRPRVTLFEVSLPIPGRQLLLARILSVQATVWLPALTAIGVLALRWGPSSEVIPPVWNIACITALAVLLPVVVRLPEISTPAWLNASVSAAAGAAGLAVWDLFSGKAVIPIFVVAGATVFLKAWTTMPPTFQVAPVKPASSSRRFTVPDIGPTAWRSIVQSAFSWQELGVGALMMFLAVTGTGWFYFLPIFCLQAVSRCRRRLGWLAALPLSYRALLLITLAASVGPLLGGIVLGSCFSIRPPTNPEFHGLHLRVLCLSGVLTLSLYVYFVAEFWRWRRLRQHPTLRILLTGGLTLPIVAMYGADVYLRSALVSRFQTAGLLLLHLLPDSLPVVILAAAVPVLALYFLLEYQFRQAELASFQEQASR